TFRKGKFPKLWQIERSIVLAEYGGLKIVDSDMITIVIELLDAMNKLALFLRKRHDHKTLYDGDMNNVLGFFVLGGHTYLRLAMRFSTKVLMVLIVCSIVGTVTSLSQNSPFGYH
ncbi:hypothetical protein Tco_1128601, partial [Tanacetum coccineum]